MKSKPILGIKLTQVLKLTNNCLCGFDPTHCYLRSFNRNLLLVIRHTNFWRRCRGQLCAKLSIRVNLISLCFHFIFFYFIFLFLVLVAFILFSLFLVCSIFLGIGIDILVVWSWLERTRHHWSLRTNTLKKKKSKTRKRV